MALVPPVQSKSVDGGFGSLLTLTFDSNNTAGNLIVVCHQVSGGGSTGDRVTDSRNTYGADVEDIDNTNSVGGISSAPNCGAGANTVQITGAGAQSGRNLHLLEYAGMQTATPFDKSATNTGFGTALSAGPTATLSQASELVVAFGFAGGSAQAPYTSTAPLTEVTDLAGGVDDSTVGDKEVAATTAVSVAFGATGSNNWGCIIATYKAAAAAGGHTLTLLGVGRASVVFGLFASRAPLSRRQMIRRAIVAGLLGVG